MGANLLVRPDGQRYAPFMSPVSTSLARLLVCIAFCSTLPGIPASPSALAGELRAGVAKIDITPDQPVTMSGYASRKGVSTGVHDPLSARAVVFETEGQRLVLVSTDLIGFYGGSADTVRQALLRECQLLPAELFLAAIHTHSAPTVTFDAEKGHSNNVAYSKALQQKLVGVVKAAMSNTRPAQLGYGSGSSPVGVNRREVTQDQAGKSKVILGRNPAVSTDREVQVVKIGHSPGGDLAAVLFDYPTHSTSLGPANYILSGDVHGLAEQFVERHLGTEVAAGFAGASGDIDPWYRVLPGFKTSNGWTPETVLMGAFLGQEVVHVLERIQKPTAASPIQCRMETVQLPGKSKPGEDSLAGDETAPFNITVARVGEIAFVGLGGEVFNEIGKAIKESSPFPCTLVITHCNGSAGYLPTEASYAEGGYEVQSSPFGRGAAVQVLRHVSELLADLGQP